jgi:hypothetical protein
MPEETEEDIEVENEQDQPVEPKADDELVAAEDEPGKITIDKNIKRVGKYYKAIKINTLDFEKKYNAC